jgi:hypothetical protein
MYLQYVITLTAVLDNTKIVPGQPISCRTLAVRGGHGATWSGDGRYSSEKMAQKKNTAGEPLKHQNAVSTTENHSTLTPTAYQTHYR